MGLGILMGLLAACGGCRGLPPDEDIVVDLGEVWLDSEVALRLPRTDLSSDEDLSLTAGDGYTDLRWVPASLGAVSLTLGSVVIDAMVVEAPSVWPDPIAETIALEPLSSIPASGLGDASFPDSGPIPFAAAAAAGELWVGASDQGRAWRLDVFYNHATQGIWAKQDFEDSAGWREPPGCFIDTVGLLQDGTCTGAERDRDDTIPDGWRYLHGGFVGGSDPHPEEALDGLSAMVDDTDAQRLWLLGSSGGEGWLRAIDQGLTAGPGEGDGSDPYTYRQLVPELDLSLGEGWGTPRAGLLGDGLWMASLDSGQLATLTPPGGAPAELTTLGPLLEVVQLDDVLVALNDKTVRGVSLDDGAELFSVARPAGLPSGAPVATLSAEGAAWLIWPALMLKVSPLGELTMVLPPRGVALAGLVEDVVSGGSADPLALLYAAGSGDDGGILWGASPGGGWYGSPLSLPASPRALGHARDPHDLYVLYAAGDDGCDDPNLDVLCEDGERPPIVHALYNPYGLVPPTSEGHLLNLFLSPIIETPKDNGLGIDFALGRCETVEPYGSAGCCALDWVVAARLGPNIDYFTDVIQSLGDATAAVEDDPTLVWGINPTLLQQAWRCLDSSNLSDQAAGYAAYEVSLSLPGPRSSVSAWTHTPAGNGFISDVQNWFVIQAPELGEYAPPVSDASEYQLLHDGMAMVFDPTRLPESAGDLRDEDPEALWTPLASGNSLDIADIVAYKGWADPDWLTPVRDGPLSLGQPPRSAYFFLPAGVELEVGVTKFRKKELYPLDIRDRVVDWLSTDPATPDVADPSSGVVNVPGFSWEIGTLSGLSETGAFRETLRFPVTVDEDDWAYTHRYIRRLIASTQPGDVKSWYLHIFDVSNPNGLYTANSQVTDDQDITRDAIERMNADFVTPGYARWALPEEIVEEWEEAQ
jgi:hypothetical protein